jgi:hypothetical protein
VVESPPAGSPSSAPHPSQALRVLSSAPPAKVGERGQDNDDDDDNPEPGRHGDPFVSGEPTLRRAVLSLQRPQVFGLFSGRNRRSSPKAELQLCDDGGETGAVLAAGEMSSSLFHFGCGGFSVEHDRQRPPSPAARLAVDRAQLVPVRAGVRGEALSRRRSRSRSSHEPVRCSPVSDLVECALRASSE